MSIYYTHCKNHCCEYNISSEPRSNSNILLLITPCLNIQVQITHFMQNFSEPAHDLKFNLYKLVYLI